MNFCKHIYELCNGYETQLEIGCGECFVGRMTDAKFKVGIDAFRPILEKENDNDDIIRINYDLNNIDNSLFLPDSFDLVLGSDIIEHFTKKDAMSLITDCELWAQKRVLFFVPVGNHPQDKDDRGLGNDYYQTHRSSWVPEDLEKLGYTVIYDPTHFKHSHKDTGAMICYKDF